MNDILVSPPDPNTACVDLDWLVDRFVDQIPAVREAVVASSDGLALAASQAIGCGLYGLAECRRSHLINRLAGR